MKIESVILNRVMPLCHVRAWVQTELHKAVQRANEVFNQTIEKQAKEGAKEYRCRQKQDDELHSLRLKGIEKTLIMRQASHFNMAPPCLSTFYLSNPV